MELLSPKNDYVFKRIFGDERNLNCLRSFLQAAIGLPAAEIAEMHITNPELPRETAFGKRGVMDVRVLTKKGTTINVEIQLLKQTGFRDRLLYYATKMSAEQLYSGDDYVRMGRSISVAIVDFNLIPETQQYHTIFQMRETKEHFPFSDKLEIHVLELQKLPEDAHNALADWLHFLKTKDAHKIEQLAAATQDINEAYEVLRRMSADGEERRLAEAYEKALKDEISNLAGAKREGLEEGASLAKAEIAQNLARAGMDATVIAQTTGLSTEQIEEILRNA